MLHNIIYRMSSNTNEVSANMMRVGDRVVRGKNWNHCSQDGHGEGTIIRINDVPGAEDGCRVKWDHDGSEVQSLNII